MNPPTQDAPSIAAIRRFAQARPPLERCDLCGKELAAEHRHMVEPAARRLICACDPCAMLFDGPANTRFRPVPRRIDFLADFRMTETQWESLLLPINLAFFYFSSPAGRVAAMFPSPAGATESLLTLEAWEDLKTANPVVGEFEPDVEALLVNRTGREHTYCRVPIDECFKLVGLIRTHWHGLSGGTQVWREIESFYAALRRRGAGGACG